MDLFDQDALNTCVKFSNNKKNEILNEICSKVDGKNKILY